MISSHKPQLTQKHLSPCQIHDHNKEKGDQALPVRQDHQKE